MVWSRWMAGLACGSVALLAGILGMGAGVGGQEPQADARGQGGIMVMPKSLVTLEVALGLKDEDQVLWEGEIIPSAGRLVELRVVNSGREGRAEGARFAVRASKATAKGKKEAQAGLRPAVVRAMLDAPPTARIRMTTPQGEIAFELAELPLGVPRTFLDGKVSITRQLGSVRLTERATEDDFPAAARGPDGRIWVAYVSYTPGQPIEMDQVRQRDFTSLVPRGHGDRVWLRAFDQGSWQPPVAVTEGGQDVWRPTVAVDKQGEVVVAWSQPHEGNWDVHVRRFTPPAQAGGAGRWSETTRLTDAAGSDFHVVSATDAGGAVWLAWQGWQEGRFVIHVRRLGAGAVPAGGASERAAQRTLAIGDASGPRRANNWSPAIACDSKGNVYVAWDTYAKGDYDVYLARIDADGVQVHPVAVSPRFEGRPSLVCDAQDRVWIAYELGDEQWGKDFSTSQFDRIGFDKNPGFALYVNRTIDLKCFSGGRLARPGDSLATALRGLARNQSLPRLASDPAGGLWLLLRHHPQAAGGGEVWVSSALRFDGRSWSPLQLLPDSTNLLDNRPALAAVPAGVLAIYSGDGRTSTQNRDQDDLFAAVLQGSGPVVAPELSADTPPPDAEVPVVHKEELADLARVRSFRLTHEGKDLRLLRGEFHRHTEYTAHRDQDGSLEDAWRYAFDAGCLDWMGDGDHDNGYGHEYLWWQIQKFSDVLNHPPHFVGALTYERSVVYPSGHRNVMFPERGARPLPRLTGNDQLFGTPEQGAPDVKLLYDYLKHFGAICAIHTSGTGMGTDWRDNDPSVEPIVEIYQGHRHNYEHFGAPRSATEKTQIGGYQPAGFISNALAKGYRLGFQSSSDHMSTHMSYAMVLAEEASRKGIIEAFRRRHCYAATDNILLVVRSGVHLMGDEFTTKGKPSLAIRVHGTAPVKRLHVVRDNEYVRTLEPNAAAVEETFTDMAPRVGQAACYYVRVDQSDGNLAWASPMWITYQP